MAAAAPAAMAELKLSQDLQIHGFAAQGFVLSDGNQINGTSADSSGSLSYQELGVNASWRPRGSLLLSGQLASVRNGRATDEPVVLEYFLVDYTPLQNERGRLGLRAGKLKLPIGFYNDSRDAVFTRPGILMPQGVYLDTSGGRAFGYFSAWGGALYADWFAGNHALYGEISAFGRQTLGENADIAILRTQASGDFEVGRGVLMRIADDYDGGRLRAAISLAAVTVDYEADRSQAFSFGNPFSEDGSLDFKQAVLSLQYNWPRFSITGEYVWRSFQLDELVGPNPVGLSTQSDIDPSGAYLQGTWRITPKWSSYARYDEQIRNSHDRGGGEAAAASAQLSARSGGMIPAQPDYYGFARDWTVGTRYDLTDQLSGWAELHYVDGAAWVNPLDNPRFSQGHSDRYWNFVTLLLAYRF